MLLVTRARAARSSPRYYRRTPAAAPHRVGLAEKPRLSPSKQRAAPLFGEHRTLLLVPSYVRSKSGLLERRRTLRSKIRKPSRLATSVTVVMLAVVGSSPGFKANCVRGGLAGRFPRPIRLVRVVTWSGRRRSYRLGGIKAIGQLKALFGQRALFATATDWLTLAPRTSTGKDDCRTN